MKTVIGLFDTSADAYSAQNELLAAGISRDRISVVTSETNKDYRKNLDVTGPHNAHTTDRTEAAEGAGIGATAGALAGGAAGVLASLGLLAIPGIGWLLAAGPIVAALTGAGIGAAAGGLLGGLIGLGIPEHEAEVYAEGIQRGGTLVTVDAGDREADRIAAILTQHHAIDIDQRAAEWEVTGWQRKYPSATAAPAPTAVPPVDTSASIAGALTGKPIDARNRGVERSTVSNSGDDANSTGSMDPANSGIGSTHRTSSARIYNPR